MKILVGGTELNVTSCEPFRHDNGKIEIKAVIPADGNNEADLRALFKNNTEDILKYADDGVTVIETLSGFRFTVDTAYKEKTNSFVICAEGVSEAEFQNGILRQRIAEQNTVIASHNETIKAQKEEIIILNDTLLELLMA